MRIVLSLFLLAFLTLTGCSSAKNNNSTTVMRNDQGDTDVNSTDVDVLSGVDLTTYLRRIPGVTVQGNGITARIQVRGTSSFGAVSTPLFVVDGNILGTNYSTLLSTVDPVEIASVRVLKDASETAAYGLQGGNGVLEFKLKK